MGQKPKLIWILPAPSAESDYIWGWLHRGNHTWREDSGGHQFSFGIWVSKNLKYGPLLGKLFCFKCLLFPTRVSTLVLRFLGDIFIEHFWEAILIEHFWMTFFLAFFGSISLDKNYKLLSYLLLLTLRESRNNRQKSGQTAKVDEVSNLWQVYRREPEVSLWPSFCEKKNLNSLKFSLMRKTDKKS